MEGQRGQSINKKTRTEFRVHDLAREKKKKQTDMKHVEMGKM